MNVIENIKLCKGCKSLKCRSEFNNSKGWADGKHQYCKSCHRLHHKALVIAAHQAGYTGRQKWMKEIPVLERKAAFNAVFLELLGLTADVSPVGVQPIKLEDNLLREVRSRHKDELQKLRNSQSQIDEGFVYIITNPAWPNLVKIGCAIDYEDRLNGYQTYDPYRAYRLEFSKYFQDRKKAEETAHRIFQNDKVNGEWFSLDIQEAVLGIESITIH